MSSNDPRQTGCACRSSKGRGFHSLCVWALSLNIDGRQNVSLPAGLGNFGRTKCLLIVLCQRPRMAFLPVPRLPVDPMDATIIDERLAGFDLLLWYFAG